MAYGDLKVRNLIWNTGSGDNTVVLSTLATQSYVTTNFAPKANPTFTGTINGADLILSGNLTVNGTQTIINTQTLDVEDKQIEIGKVSSPSDTTANEGGWKLKGASDKTFLWYDSTDAWTSSEHIHIPDDKKLLIGTGSDLSIYHSSSNSQNTIKSINGRINFNAAETRMEGADGSELIGRFIENGAVELYHNNAKKFETFDNGLVVYGPDSSDCYIYLYADNGGENADRWRVKADASGNFGIGNKSTGSWVDGLTLNGSNSATFAGDINLADNKKFIAGDGNDLQIYHDGSNSYLINTTGDLQVNSQGDDLLLQAADDIYLMPQGSDAGVTIKGNGAVELYHNNNKKIETTSTGINVTGQINVNGSALSAAPEITAVADGAIAANKPCCIKENGKVAEIKNTTVSAATGSNTDVPHRSGYTPQARDVVWISDTKFVMFWNADNDNDQIYGAVGTVSGTTISYGANTAISGYNYISVRTSFQGSYDATSDAIALAYGYTDRSSSQTRWRVQGLTVSGTTISVNSTSSDSTGSSGVHITRIACDGKGGFAVTWALTNGTWYVKAGTISSTGAIAVGSQSHIANSIDTGYDQGLAIAYDPDEDRWAVFGKYSNAYVRQGIYTRSGTTINNVTLNGSPSSLWGPVKAQFDVCYDQTNKQFWSMSQHESSNNLSWHIFRWNGAKTLLSNPQAATAFTSNMDVQGRMAYDKALDKFFWLFADSSGQNTKFLTVSLSENTASVSSETIANHKEQNGLAVGCNGSGLVLTGVDKSDNSDINTRAKQLQVTTSNLKANTYIGFSDAAYSDGNTATVKVVSNTTTQSGLTPAKTYYIQKAGTLATGADDPSVVAGIALSSTKLLIKG